MRLLFILVGLGLISACFIPSINIFLDGPVVKAFLFYVGIFVILAGFGGVADWLEHKSKNHRDEIKP